MQNSKRMKFGHFFYPMKFDDKADGREIQDCLYEAQLIEELGMDAIWFAEHHFTGECVYGDPLVFAGAVAVKTKKVTLGLGILELPLHNPVRVAIQTALLDNLSKGRLVVGTASGSNYNAYEYIGFGTSPEAGADQIDEAEDLLVKAWTSDNVQFKGKYWEVSFPSIRPRPYQKPHPPLARACIGDESVRRMAKLGRPVLLRGSSTSSVGNSISLYRDTMLDSGFNEEDVEKNLDQIWVWREMHLAPTNDEALDDFLPAHYKAYSTMETIRTEWNPKSSSMSIQRPPMDRTGYKDEPDPESPESLVGSPRRVAEQVDQLKQVGVRNLMLTNRGLMSLQKTTTSLKLLSEQVMPLFESN